MIVANCSDVTVTSDPKFVRWPIVLLSCCRQRTLRNGGTDISYNCNYRLGGSTEGKFTIANHTILCFDARKPEFAKFADFEIPIEDGFESHAVACPGAPKVVQNEKDFEKELFQVSCCPHLQANSGLNSSQVKDICQIGNTAPHNLLYQYFRDNLNKQFARRQLQPTNICPKRHFISRLFGKSDCQSGKFKSVYEDSSRLRLENLKTPAKGMFVFILFIIINFLQLLVELEQLEQLERLLLWQLLLFFLDQKRHLKKFKIFLIHQQSLILPNQ